MPCQRMKGNEGENRNSQVRTGSFRESTGGGGENAPREGRLLDESPSPIISRSTKAHGPAFGRKNQCWIRGKKKGFLLLSAPIQLGIVEVEVPTPDFGGIKQTNCCWETLWLGKRDGNSELRVNLQPLSSRKYRKRLGLWELSSPVRREFLHATGKHEEYRQVPL